MPSVTIAGSSIADGNAQTYMATASGGDNIDKIAWYLNDSNTMAMGTSYSKVVKDGDVISAIYYPFYPSGDSTTGSNRIKIGNTQEVTGIIETPAPAPTVVLPPPPVAPPAPAPPVAPPPNVGIGFPSNILTPPIPPSKPEPESMNSIIMPPFIPMLPPMPMPPSMASPMADNITPYLPYIIGGVLLYVLFF